MYNKAFLIGNLTRDPELRYTPAGIPVARFAIAINRIQRKGAPADPNRQTVDFINIVAWRRLAEICGEYLKKGAPVAIEGRLQVRSYEKDGEKRTMAEVIADNMQMLSRRSAPGAVAETTKPTGAKSSEEEIPF